MIILDHENQMLYFHKRKPDLKMGNLTVCVEYKIHEYIWIQNFCTVALIFIFKFVLDISVKAIVSFSFLL